VPAQHSPASAEVGTLPFGRAYALGFAVLAVSLTVLALLRWPHTVHLLLIGLLSTAAAGVGVLARRRRSPGWVYTHGIAMTVSYVGLWTGFLIDNGPLLPVWRELPHVLHWTLPSIVAVPLLVRTLSRFRSEAPRRASV
jgi:hypothetical protein